MNKLKIKKGDTVKVLSGKDKGKTGKVIFVDPKNFKVTVENVNLHTRFQRARKAGQLGTKVVTSSPLSVSKVQLVDPNSGSPTRVGYELMENGVKQRIAKKSGKAI